MRADSYVFNVPTDRRGRVTGVKYFDLQKRENFQKARAVVLCANGAETPRLLLNSASSRFPDGLANSSGLVGKYLMFNSGGEVGAVFEQALNEYKSAQVTRIVHDFYDSDPKRGFYGGGGMDARIGPQPIFWALREEEGAPRWGAEFKARLQEFPRAMIGYGHTTSLPLATNSVSIDPELKDAWGIPAIRATYRDHPDDLAMARFLQNHQVAILRGRRRPAGRSGAGRRGHAFAPPARHLPHGQRPAAPPSSIASIARTTCATSSSATAAAS